MRIFAAASLTDALGEVALQWERRGHPPPVVSYAGSAVLARQVDAGAPADIYLSADPAWMDYLASRKRIEPGTRIDLLGNSLVMVVPRGVTSRMELRRGFAFARAFDGKLCMGDPDVVPAGTYAREALRALGYWDSIAKRVVGSDDVRAALAFVERGECGAGIVYATDAAMSDRVQVVARFPPGLHRPIVYPVALTARARPQARTFLDHLRTSSEVAEVFARYGFVVLPRERH